MRTPFYSKLTSSKVPAIFFALLMLAAPAFAQSQHQLRSPDGRIEVQIRIADRIYYSVILDDNAKRPAKPLLRDSTLSLRVDQQVLGLNPKVTAAKTRNINDVIDVPVPRKSAQIREAFNELRLEMEGNYTVVFRAYDEGVAYRFETSLSGSEIKIGDEEARFKFGGDYTAYFPREDSFFSHNERDFRPMPLSKIEPTTIASIPAVIDADGVKIAIADSDIEDYPGLWLRGNSDNSLEAIFPPYPLKEELTGDRDLRVSQSAEYIAVTRGNRSFPWRVIGIAENDRDLITNQLVYLLAKTSQVPDTSWIKPGKVAWDWWNANNIYGVDFKAGINTQTYKYYIDFASKYGIEYIILDEGWYKLGNLLNVVPDINVEELVAYGRQKHVGVILWVIWKTLDDQLEPALNQFEKWGVKGIKVDFMQRDDQKLIAFYHKVCREAAKRHLLVDFHGGVRPATMTRTWPNLISTEGVKGLEWNKWSEETTPEHDLELPFTRMFLGPMDYTPGAMLNATKSSFAHVFMRPMSQGTRCHQLAMYVVFESPLQMLADSPSNYLREPETMEFLGPVPTTWDETKPLDGKITDYVVVARRKGSDWYVGAMTDWTARDLEIDFSFLPAGKFEMESFEDGPNANRFASDYRRTKQQVDRSMKIKIRLAEGGGWAARLRAL
jgi:alpha-glucosidase